MKKEIAFILILVVVFFPCGCHGKPDILQGNYILQLPGFCPETGRSHKRPIKSYNVSVQTSSQEYLLVVPLSHDTKWYHLENSKGEIWKGNSKQLNQKWDKQPGWVAYPDGRKLTLTGLWLQGEAAILVTLEGKRGSKDIWTGKATAYFEAHVPENQRLFYKMDWSLSKPGAKAPAISTEVSYRGPKVKRFPVKVDMATPDNVKK